ncbi:DUF4352 domain-containing protein [Clostridium sp.]|uniref:DUF4352 domain-containing protein n=1 Tax=Clostridium sp. TaxID=1506 RepID=UPI0032177A8D
MSKLVKCKSCGKEISKGAKCPECGKDNKNFFMKHKVLTVILAIVIIGAVGGAAGSSGDDSVSKVDGDKPSTSSEQQESRNFEIGQTAEKANNYKVSVNSLSEYTSTNQFMKAPEGKKYVVANVTVENLTADKDIAVSSLMCFNLLSVDGVKYNIAITDAEGQLDGTVAPGRKLTGNVSYEVPAELTEAELEVKLDVFTGKPIYFKGPIK